MISRDNLSPVSEDNVRGCRARYVSREVGASPGSLDREHLATQRAVVVSRAVRFERISAIYRAREVPGTSDGRCR